MEMRKISCRLFPAVLITGFFLGMLPLSLNAGEVPRITKEELKKMLDKPDVIILDVRVPPEWEQSAFKIKGAKRLEIPDAESGKFSYPKDKIIVLYCA